MKKIFATLFIAGVSIGMFSCNNGDYDANPETNDGLNPLNPNSGVTVPLGTVKLNIRGIEYVFFPGAYADSVVPGIDYNMFLGYSRMYEPDVFKREVQLTFIHSEGANPDVSEKTLGAIRYSYFDTTVDQRVYYEVPPEALFDTTLANPRLRGLEDGNIRGIIEPGKMRLVPTYRETKHGSLMLPPIKDTFLMIMSGEFYLPKKEVRMFYRPYPNVINWDN